MVNDICLRCHQRPKRKNYQFCSPRCTNIAASQAPRLLRVPKGHVMYDEMKKAFKSQWRENTPLPTLASMYLITWTKKSRVSFDKYKALVAKRSKPQYKERKRWRAEKRACHLGEGKNTKFCNKHSCQLCRALKTTFGSSFKIKKDLYKKGDKKSIRYGPGMYVAPSSNRGFNFAKNISGNRSMQLAVLSVRVVEGKHQVLHKEEPRRTKPKKGYDSVQGKGSNGQTEYVVYNKDAIRPAYLMMFK